MKKILFILLSFSLVITSCTKEELVKPKAFYSTKTDTAYIARSFWVYLDAEGDFFTFFAGNSDGSKWENYPTSKGISINNRLDSIDLNKLSPSPLSVKGEFDMTLVVSSYGNWAEDEAMAVYAKKIVVLDDRNGVSEFYFKEGSKKAIKGAISISTSKIYFSSSAFTDLTSLTPQVKKESAAAKAYIDDVEIKSTSRVDMSSKEKNLKVVSELGNVKEYTIIIKD